MAFGTKQRDDVIISEGKKKKVDIYKEELEIISVKLKFAREEEKKIEDKSAEVINLDNTLGRIQKQIVDERYRLEDINELKFMAQESYNLIDDDTRELKECRKRELKKLAGEIKSSKDKLESNLKLVDKAEKKIAELDLATEQKEKNIEFLMKNLDYIADDIQDLEDDKEGRKKEVYSLDMDIKTKNQTLVKVNENIKDAELAKEQKRKEVNSASELLAETRDKIKEEKEEFDKKCEEDDKAFSLKQEELNQEASDLSLRENAVKKQEKIIESIKSKLIAKDPKLVSIFKV